MLNRKNVNFEGDVKHNSIQDIDEEQKKQKRYCRSRKAQNSERAGNRRLDDGLSRPENRLTYFRQMILVNII